MEKISKLLNLLPEEARSIEGKLEQFYQKNYQGNGTKFHDFFREDIWLRSRWAMYGF
jgi:hypothetical protein